jgi:valyl-tRNA synthetase
MLNMFDAEAKVAQVSDGLIPESFVGMERFAARAAVVEAMNALGALVPYKTKNKEGEEIELDAEPRTIQTPYGDRGGVVIEPWLTDQWYVNAAELAKAPMAAVRSGAIEIVPKTWEKTFFNWMENIQPWCVSRQLWWGHRIPAWYGSDGQIYVAETEDAAQAQTGATVTLARDEDVLDTWFSSALWPFATLGWPDEGDAKAIPRSGEGWVGAPGAETAHGGTPTPQPSPHRGEGAGQSLLQRHYPNDLLISGFDILFFWCARMAMMGLQFQGEVPWKRLYLHGLVRAADGQKMSKSKGNVIDPLVLIDQYGADALRFFMASMESQGRDVKMDERRVEGYRNFATKLWNAARFCQSNGIGASTSLSAPAATSAVNRWIIGEVVETVAALDAALADLRFDAAANMIYHFVWDQFCDWYIELVKGNFDEETRAVAGWVLDQILVMLHPFMPFVTEELWHALGERQGALIVARWPDPGAVVDGAAKREVEWLIELVSNMRAAKNELLIAPGTKLTAWLPEPSSATRAIIEANGAVINRLARVLAIHFAPAPVGAAMQVGAGDANMIVPLEGIVDIAAEKARLEKALVVSTKERDSLAKRLDNPAFAEKAKPEAVDKARADFAAHAAEAERLAVALGRLG